MSKIYGLTGGIAAGKSTVLEILKESGCRVYDADQVARQVVEVGSIGLKQISRTFGMSILQADGTLDRKKLSQIVFSDPNELKKLTNITAPLIRQKIKNIVNEVKNSTDPGISFFEIQLLFESNYQKLFDGVVTIYVDPDTQLKRLIGRNHLSKEEALRQINSQMSMDEKKRLADYVIDNTGDLFDLKNEINDILKLL